MFRKTIVAIAAAAAIGAAALVPATASAAPGHHGGKSFRSVSHGHVGHVSRSFHRGPAFRVFAPLHDSCWRWVPGRFGLVKVWVCG